MFHSIMYLFILLLLISGRVIIIIARKDLGLYKNRKNTQRKIKQIMGITRNNSEHDLQCF